MQKISLKSLNFKEVEQLSREQLKNVLGGGSVETEEAQPCPDGEFKCKCSGKDFGCVCTVQECIDLCP